MELAIVFVLALIILGPKRLPEAGKSLGQGIREFKSGITGSGIAGSTELQASADERSGAAPTDR
jgi:sec-independent protein translocase protein TatA